MSTSTSWEAFEERIAAAASLSDIEAIDHELFGRKAGAMTEALKGLKDIPNEEKKAAAQELNMWKKKFGEMLDEKKSELGGGSSEGIDVTLELPQKQRGHHHLIPEFIRQIEEVFGRMGFDTAYGPEIETEDLNFNKLNIPDDHPARDGQDTFWIKGVKNTVLRTHTSPVQIRYMQEHKPPFRMICPGKVYRKDSDATHSPMFHQFEGLMIGKDITLANLKAVLVTSLRELIGRDVEFRFRTGYFPFVEPGMEMDMMWQGDLEDSREGKWLEMGGCGMVHPNVLRNVDIDPDEWQGFAFGFGVERPLMIKHQIPDLRSFYEGDLRFLRQF
ncbi:MAG: phenylalanine--tRNA ligase subunit alpha [Candidatus Peribacter sp.]|jgi:phenylalanyl-tRNA synthetase alpha chain|nr:phenylalanine--tRNA ligase subunit alpha [Candidatus Peribacter sp.]MBT4392938.1 phenylalanine--tRNA ligase subunit alpha [Candidatus Peribacter sp.]MBT5149040.1 phenylalanine--tRNA ligase subunit alpha [Candidatus Peribacter sp.]MBT5637364.1 phenylalanine--tRNA ligase subunit alpha [Candidatus Peribacter sp.]MBT5937318.1 phenylalanine--tRNA ligase subunit alpha [Candidatus Peribacter sp.]